MRCLESPLSHAALQCLEQGICEKASPFSFSSNPFIHPSICPSHHLHLQTPRGLTTASSPLATMHYLPLTHIHTYTHTLYAHLSSPEPNTKWRPVGLHYKLSAPSALCRAAVVAGALGAHAGPRVTLPLSVVSRQLKSISQQAATYASSASIRPALYALIIHYSWSFTAAAESSLFLREINPPPTPPRHVKSKPLSLLPPHLKLTSQSGDFHLHDQCLFGDL